MFKKILELIIKILTYKMPPKEVTKEVTKEEKPQEEVNIPIEVETPKIEPETKPSEVYTMLSVKEYQTYLKKIGLYTKGIDGIVGNGTEKAIYQFNTIFLNDKSGIYTEKTDRLLRVIYETYSKSPYMKDSDWQYFKNFKKTEYKCPKWCDGYPHEIAFRLVMANQYARNIHMKPINISSGVRCQKHNDELKNSAKNSKHLVGEASDSGINGVSASALMKTYGELAFVYYKYAITSKYVHISVKF
jgi:hypothetical protein